MTGKGQTNGGEYSKEQNEPITTLRTHSELLVDKELYLERLALHFKLFKLYESLAETQGLGCEYLRPTSRAPQEPCY